MSRKPRKDGIDDEPFPVVQADSWQEAFALGGEYVEYQFPGGSVAFGGKVTLSPLNCSNAPAPRPD